MNKFILLPVSILLFLASCQSAHHSATTAHNKELINVIAGGKTTKQPDEAIRLAPVHFPTGSDAILNEEIGSIDSNVSWLEKNPQAVLVLEGHCDERGGDLYNIELGDRRARSVKSHLINKGIASDRLIMVVSYGKRAPIDPRHVPEAWNVNRRVELIVR